MSEPLLLASEAHYFETGEVRGWVATAFIGLGILTLCVPIIPQSLWPCWSSQLRQRPKEPFTEFLVRCEAQAAKVDRLNVADRDKIKLLQMALHTDFDARCRMANIPEDNYF
ncbi:hypothetical protein E4U59_000284 [Claviceps monticola]|nr:hypothetical protein E4U59_000284 [Claviceps monticola]